MEHFAHKHKGLIIGMDRHLLIKMADMLHGISPPIVNGKRRLRKLMRKFGLVNPPSEGPYAMVGRPFLTLIAALLLLVLVRRGTE
nr:hypothetical protein CFP56_74353 [Quercus suber]